MKKNRHPFLGFVCCAFFLVNGLWAQQEYGHLSGTVTDMDGAPLANVKVLVTGKYIISERNAVTNENGTYSVRNLSLGPATVTFVMTGFQTLKHTDVPINLGKTTDLDIKMALADMELILTVSTEKPLIDTSDAQTGAAFSAVEVEKMPTTKDPWSVIELTPGVSLSLANVGGNKQGTQARFSAHGTSPYQNAYYVDGINLTDTSASGASGQYYDFDTFEEFSISTGSHDASVGAPGVNVSMVTKTGSNQFEGRMSYGYSADSLQSDNHVTYESNGTQHRLSSPQDSNEDLNLNLSGPIIKDRLWFFAAYHKNDVSLYAINTRDTAKETLDVTELEQINANIKWAITPNNTLRVGYNENEKSKSNRLPTSPGTNYFLEPGTAWAQKGPGDAWFIHDDWVFGSGTVFSIKYGQQTYPFSLAPHAQAPDDVLTRFPVVVDRVNVRATSATYYPTYNRENRTIMSKINHFATLGASSHDITFGFERLASENLTRNQFAGNARVEIQRYTDGVASGEVWFYRGIDMTSEIENSALYLTDEITYGKWTINLGLRYQMQRGHIQDGSLAGTWQNVPEDVAPGFADRFGDVNVGRLDDAAEWNDLLPRINLTYDLHGDGRTVFKLGLNQYAWTLNTNEFEMASALADFEEDYAWTDRNGDGQFLGDGSDWGEIDFSTILWSSGVSTGTPIDEDYSAPITDEAIFNVSHQIDEGFVVGANLIYRRNSNVAVTLDRGRVGLDRYELTTWTDSNGNSHPFYRFLDPSTPSDFVQTNLDSYETEFVGLDVSFAKRGANYLISGSLAWGDNSVSYDLDELDDPNQPFHIFGDRGDRVAGAYQPEWQGNLYGSYTLPWWEVELGAKIRYNSGNYVTSYEKTSNGIGTSEVLIHGIENETLPSYFLVDLSAGKKFSLFGSHQFEAKLDLFNLLDEDAIISYASLDRGSSRYLDGGEILGPRVARFNLVYSF
ncbi:TonB-dependent receptor [Sulfidibacter corallicola]|uniref:TonB-dependent receptor n=1 Tax=Sulfidibacter corallicola TaxID=2818388 RepID=A0A8A4TR02_SULCO|nr:TonB-dependent receptor [Sulfidibacter corallicola]QTD52406.1 TonB-dependent receptor [Sulfidibacter corallicola]